MATQTLEIKEALTEVPSAPESVTQTWDGESWSELIEEV